MISDEDALVFNSWMQESDIDFRTDVSYAVAVAKAARSVLAKKAKQVAKDKA